MSCWQAQIIRSNSTLRVARRRSSDKTQRFASRFIWWSVTCKSTRSDPSDQVTVIKLYMYRSTYIGRGLWYMNSEKVQHTTKENLKIQHQSLPNDRPRYSGILYGKQNETTFICMLLMSTIFSFHIFNIFIQKEIILYATRKFNPYI